MIPARAHTTVHLLPSSSFLAGFFTLMLSGLGFFPGAGLLARAVELPPEAVELARRDGFLWVICDLSTLRSPLVTSSPLFSSENTAPRPDDPEDGASAAGSVFMSSTGGGPGGGGGGPGGPPAEGAWAPCDESMDLATSRAEPPLGFQGRPLAKCCFSSSDSSQKMA